MVPKYECDFETNNYNNEHADVWAWGSWNIHDETFEYGSEIGSFMRWLFQCKKTIYFHNLEFDGCFIMDWLFRNGFSYSKKLSLEENKTFSAVISDANRYYIIVIKENNELFHIYDSLKTIPSSVKKMCEDYGLPIQKGKIDYRKIRVPGMPLEEDDLIYLKADCQAPSIVQKFLFENKMTNITAGSNAFNYYVKHTFGSKDSFRKTFPVDKFDTMVRKAYKGGYTYLNPRYAGKEVGKGMVCDVNSMYPSVMHSPYLYPYGEGEYHKGKFKIDENRPIFFQCFTADFILKRNRLPTFQLKNSRYHAGDYITKTEHVTVTMTNVDLKLCMKHYKLKNIQWHYYINYKAKSGMFDDYIDYWYNIKKTAPKHSAEAQLAKLMLNSLYGKFATHPVRRSRHVEFVNNMIHLTKIEEQQKESIYVAVAAMVTSYGREKVINAAQANYDRFIYSDTDSIHLLEQEHPKDIIIDKSILGEWDDESYFNNAKFLRPKLYMEIGEEKVVKGAGLSDDIKKDITMDNFFIGAEFTGNLKKRIVPGGCILMDCPFKIRE